MPNPTDPKRALLAQAGRALYGHRWMRPLSLALDTPLNTCQLWNSGIRPIPPETWPDILKLIAAKRRELQTAARMIQAQVLQDRSEQLRIVGREIGRMLRRNED
jgi:hypothetical protein